MKITDLAILFIIIILPFNFILDIKTRNTQIAVYKKMEINRVLDTAVEDGVANLVESSGNKKVTINKERASSAFFNTLYLNFDIFDNELAQKQLDGYIPCLVVVDYDGFYVMDSQEFINARGEKEVKMIWSPKHSYSCYDSGYVYCFTLDNTLKVYDTYSNKLIQGTVDQVSKEVTTNILSAPIDLESIEVGSPSPEDLANFQKFDQLRRRTIIECLKREINFSINKHNDIARRFGITYNFTLPIIDDEDWYKTIDDITLMVFFQGMPIGITDEKINNFALGGARTVKAPKYYLQEDPVTHVKYYHKEHCPLLFDKTVIEDSRKEAAKKGYLPCDECKS